MTKQYSKNILHTNLSFFKTFSRPIGTRRKQEDENNWDNNNNNNGNFDNGQWNPDKYVNGHWQPDDNDNQKQNNRNPGNRQQFRRPNKPNVNQWKPNNNNNNGDNGQWKSGDEHQWKPPSEVKITNVNFKKTSNVTRPLSGDYKVVCCKKHIYSLFGIRNRRFMLKMNCLRKMLQNLQYFWNTKTHVVFFVFHFVLFYFFPNECPGLCRQQHSPLDQDIH